MFTRHFLLALSLAVALTTVSCSPGSRTLPTSNAPNDASAPGVGPYTPSSHATLQRTMLPNQVGNNVTSALKQLASSSSTRAAQSYSNPNDIEQVGVFTNPGGYYSATFAYIALWPVSAIQIAHPAGSTDTSAIYESLTANNGGCLGNFLTYINSGSGTQGVYSVYNYCGTSPGIVFQTPVDSNFINDYTTHDGSGEPLVGTEVFTYDLKPNANSVWYSVLDNSATGQHEIVAQATGVLSSRTTGFVLWTSELQPQPCPVIPTMGAENVVMWDNSANTWNYVTPTMTGATSTLATPASSYGCFNNQKTLGPITEYSLPSDANIQGSPSPDGITAGPDGNEWFSESRSNQVGKITSSGASTLYTTPNSSNNPSSITLGPDGNLWFQAPNVQGSRIDKVTTSGVFTEYDLPSQSQSNGFNTGITAGPDGNIWFTNYNPAQIGKLTTSGTFTVYALPSGSAEPGGIVTGPDGNLWFTEWNPSKIGKITTAGKITEYPLPSSPTRYPYWITAGPDGNLWFTEEGNNAIGKITPSGVITEYPTPTQASVPTEITVGADGNLWFTENGPNKIGRITTSGSITEYPAPSLASYQFTDVTSNYHWLVALSNLANSPWAIAPGPIGSRTVWFTDYTANRIGKVTLP